MPAEARLEAARAGDAVLNQRLAPVVPFLGDLPRQLLRLPGRAALWREIFALADGQVFLRRHFPPGQIDI
jgi:hypothetical protein